MVIFHNFLYAYQRVLVMKPNYHVDPPSSSMSLHFLSASQAQRRIAWLSTANSTHQDPRQGVEPTYKDHSIYTSLPISSTDNKNKSLGTQGLQPTKACLEDDFPSLGRGTS